MLDRRHDCVVIAALHLGQVTQIHKAGGEVVDLLTLAAVLEHNITCCLHRTCHIWIQSTRNSLISLTMVIGAEIKILMVLPRIPTHYLIVRFIPQHGVVHPLVSIQLGIEPTARYYGMGFKKLE